MVEGEEQKATDHPKEENMLLEEEQKATDQLEEDLLLEEKEQRPLTSWRSCGSECV